MNVVGAVVKISETENICIISSKQVSQEAFRTTLGLILEKIGCLQSDSAKYDHYTFNLSVL